MQATDLTGTLKKEKIAVVGLGYVGLPLAVALARHHDVIGYDINHERIEELSRCEDKTREVPAEALFFVLNSMTFTTSSKRLESADIIIVTVPTPVDKRNIPDLTALKAACLTIGTVMKPGAIIVFESTVYPGCTEQVCIHILETASNGRSGKDFFVAYSPERVNPGDKEHTLSRINKIVGCPNPDVRKRLVGIYKDVCQDVIGFDDIRVCEAAKAIENVQRDVNIALVNEFALLFARMGIDTAEVLRAAGTKWNFLKFKPGLVGGHCIGVDPYYLAHSAHEHGFHPELILAGRRINESMAKHVAYSLVKRMWQRMAPDQFFRVLILGSTFKENCPDTRNSKVPDIVKGLKELGCEVMVFDPYLPEPQQMVLGDIYKLPWDGIILAVPHNEFHAIDWPRLKRNHAVLYDVKSVLPDGVAEIRL